MPEVEYLRIKVIDPTGRLLDDAYFIVHFLNAPDCLDLDAGAAAKAAFCHPKPRKWRALFSKVIEIGRFQPAEFSEVTLIGTALAEALAKGRLFGFSLYGTV